MRVEARHPLLVVRLSALGDVIHTIPAVAAIRRSQPGFAIGWAVEAVHADLVESVAPADVVFPLQMRRWRTRPFSIVTTKALLRDLARVRRFARGGTAVDFQGLFKSALVARMSGARHRIGFDARGAREAISVWLSNRHVGPAGEHVIEKNMALAEAVGAQPIDPLSIDFTHFARDRSGRLGVLMHDRPVVLLPGAGRADKRWPAASFAELAEGIVRMGRSVLIAWGPGEEGLARAVAERTTAVQVAPPTDLRELAFLLRGASCVVGGDTGPIHLAAALKARIVGLYGPTDPRRNGPWNQIHRCVESWSKGRTMDEISVEDVMSSVQKVLSEILI